MPHLSIHRSRWASSCPRVPHPPVRAGRSLRLESPSTHSLCIRCVALTRAVRGTRCPSARLHHATVSVASPRRQSRAVRRAVVRRRTGAGWLGPAGAGATRGWVPPTSPRGHHPSGGMVAPWFLPAGAGLRLGGYAGSGAAQPQDRWRAATGRSGAVRNRRGPRR